MILFGFVKDYSTCTLKNGLLWGKSRSKEMGQGWGLSLMRAWSKVGEEK